MRTDSGKKEVNPLESDYEKESGSTPPVVSTGQEAWPGGSRREVYPQGHLHGRPLPGDTAQAEVLSVGPRTCLLLSLQLFSSDGTYLHLKGN